MDAVINIKPQEKRILVVKLSSLGDLLHALPAVHNIKTKTGARVDWAVQREYAGLVRCFTEVENVIPFPRRGFAAGFFPFLRALRARRYTYVLDMQGLLKSALVSRLARGMQRIGPSFHREGARFFYTSFAGPADRKRHAVEEIMDVADHLKIDRIPPVFPLAFPERPPDGPSPRIAMFPATRWPTKNWPAENFAAVGRALQRQLHATILVMGSGEDAAACRYVARDMSPPAINLAGVTSLTETGSVLSKADLVISNDSGPMHMAAAIGIPVVAVFGPTDPARTGPYGRRHRSLCGRIECRPCFSRRCRLGRPVCLREVPVSAVIQAAREIIEINA